LQAADLTCCGHVIQVVSWCRLLQLLLALLHVALVVQLPVQQLSGVATKVLQVATERQQSDGQHIRLAQLSNAQSTTHTELLKPPEPYLHLILQQIKTTDGPS
jgi:aspartate oxidase